MRCIVALLAMVLPFMLVGQFSDNFSDGDFTNDPVWEGDEEKFIVDNGLLRLYDDEAGTAWLATESGIVHHTQWEFWVRLAFTPSDNNHARIYLVSNQKNLTGPLQGYFIQIGKTGGDNKRIYFYRQDGEHLEELMAGSMNIAEATNNILRLRILRDGAGNWEFMADPSGGAMYVMQGHAFDNTYTTTSWFGIVCRYTVSNSRRFYFDDFYAGEIIPLEAPSVKNVQVVTANTLDVTFSGMLDHASAVNAMNYVVDGGVGHPLVVAFDDEHPSVVRLLFGDSFQENHLYTIGISGVANPDGQLMDAWEGQFVHYVSSLFDVVFNELMVNSRPEVALPPHDWLELYNTTELPLNLEGWVLQHGSTQRELPRAVLPPKGYLVLCTEEAYELMQGYGNVAAVPGLSATALTIGGTDLVLWDDRGNLISFVSYNSLWYRNPAKAQGGWSLEKIDPYNFCQGAENWTASVNENGGTPGMQNSVFGSNPDQSPPRLLRAAPLDSLNVRLTFSEPMDRRFLEDVQHYAIDHDIGRPLSVEPLLPDLARLDMLLPGPLQPGVIYTLTVSGLLTDCAGNNISQRQCPLALAEKAAAGDLVINEILFNPPDFGARYIELFNPSDKVFDLADFVIASEDTLEHLLTTVQNISQEGFLFFPGDYVVLTADTAAVKRTFLSPAPDAFMQLAAMPRMTNAGGIAVLATRGHQQIDKLIYTEDMHVPLLTSAKGVALERLSPNRPTQDVFNWHSAAASAGFGTPGYRNSQHLVHHANKDTSFSLGQKIFAPDGSGHNDVLNIFYTLEQPGYVANIRVFDSRGRPVRLLVQGKLLATSGVINWDGTNDAGLKASVGLYIIHVEVFNTSGNVHHHKLTAVLAGQL